jgi:hypothetical protein
VAPVEVNAVPTMTVFQNLLVEQMKKTHQKTIQHLGFQIFSVFAKSCDRAIRQVCTRLVYLMTITNIHIK